MNNWENIWTFKSGRFCVAFDVEPCDDDPADSFADEAAIEAIREGRVWWFNARVRILWDHNVIGADYLSACAYEDILGDFVQSHWRTEYAHRNTLAARAVKISYCDYFPDMVRAAVRDARATISKFRGIERIRVRT